MANEAKKASYIPFWKDTPIDPDVNTKTKRYLVKDLKELNTILNVTNKDKEFMSYDSETTGLDPTAYDAEIVGYSFSFNATEGYYVAVAHDTGAENTGVEGLQMIYDRMCKAKKVFVANLPFDCPYMEFEGERKGRNWSWESIDYYDIFVGLFLADTNIKFPSLKKSAKKWLGWCLDSFEETLGNVYNFKYLTPQQSYTYAGFDAIMTFALAPISLKFFKESKLSGKIDNKFLYPFSQMMKGTVKMDLALSKEYELEMTERYNYLEKEIYRMVGGTFNINSPKQLSEALTSIGFDTGIRSKSGYMKAGIKELEDQNDKTPNDIVAVLVEYKKLAKSISTFVKPYIENENIYGDRFRYGYNLYSAPTCRLAGGKDGKNRYYTPINVMAVTKPKGKIWYVHEYHGEELVHKYDRVILDWRFSIEDKSDYIIEGLDPHWNIRNQYMPNDGDYWVSIDYSAEELKAIANYADIPFWKDTMLNGGDLHKATAIAIWGEENYTHDLRKKAKAGNFGFSYGMHPITASNQFKMPLEEAEDLVNGWWKAVPELRQHQARNIREAKKTGTIYNYLGRPRRVRNWLNSPERSQVAFGERTVKNTIVQSLGSDLMKMAMIKLYNQLINNPKYKGKCQFLSSIHDECNLSISYGDRELFQEMFNVFYDCMYTKLPGWEVPFDVGIEIGTRWGDSLPFKYDENKKLVPDAEYKPQNAEKNEETKVIKDVYTIDDEDDFTFDLDL